MINVIGLGYIGLPTALILSANGSEVVGTDISDKTVEQLNKGELTFDEQGLEALYNCATTRGIRFQTNYEKTDTYIVTVPTPYDEDTKKVDVHYIVTAVEEILKICPQNATIVIESTISPGTIKRFINPLIEASVFTLEENIFLVHAPERIIPGNMLFELQNNSRTIGANTPHIGQKIKKIYQTFCKGEIICTDIKTAEMTKVIENNYRSVNIAFANEIVKIARESSLNPYEVIEICNQHPRVNILQPGPGVGGHCIPVDPWFLVGDLPNSSKLTYAALMINDSMVEWTLEKLQEIMSENGVKNFEKVGIYGLTYKADIDDTRESPSLKLIDLMEENHYQAPIFYDPMLHEKIIENQLLSFEKFIEKVELIVVMVNHTHIVENQFMLKNKIIFDAKNALNIGYKL